MIPDNPGLSRSCMSKIYTRVLKNAAKPVAIFQNCSACFRAQSPGSAIGS